MGPPVCGARRCWARSGKVHVRSRWNHFLLPPPGPPPQPAPPLGRAAPRRASMGPEPRRWAPLWPGGCGVGTGAESRNRGCGGLCGTRRALSRLLPRPALRPRQRVPLRCVLPGVLSPSLRPGYGTGGLEREGTRGWGVGAVGGRTRLPRLGVRAGAVPGAGPGVRGDLRRAVVKVRSLCQGLL